MEEQETLKAVKVIIFQSFKWYNFKRDSRLLIQVILFWEVVNDRNRPPHYALGWVNSRPSLPLSDRVRPHTVACWTVVRSVLFFHLQNLKPVLFNNLLACNQKRHTLHEIIEDFFRMMLTIHIHVVYIILYTEGDIISKFFSHIGRNNCCFLFLSP